MSAARPPCARLRHHLRPRRERHGVGALVALVVVSAALLPPLGADAATRPRLLLRCPEGTKIAVQRLPSGSHEHAAETLVEPNRALICAGPDGAAFGPVFLLRPNLRIGDRSLQHLARRAFGPRQVLWVGSQHGDRRIGRWIQYATDGRVLTTLELMGGDGRWQVRDDQGVVRVDGRYDGGMRQGQWRRMDAEGVVRAVESYENGALHGDLRLFGREGELRLQERWQRGVRDGLSTRWTAAGVKVLEGRYAADLRDGDWCRWSPSGVLLGCNALVRGTGTWRQWSDGGALLEVGELVDGRRHGEWRIYGEDGALRARGPYVHGRRDSKAWVNYTPSGEVAPDHASKVASTTVRALGLLRGGSVRVKGALGVGGGVVGGVGSGVGSGGLGLRGSGGGGSGGSGGGGSAYGVGGVGVGRLRGAAGAPTRTLSPARPISVSLTVGHSGGRQLDALLDDRARDALVARLQSCVVPAGAEVRVVRGRAAAAGASVVTLTRAIVIGLTPSGAVRHAALLPRGGAGHFAACASAALRATSFLPHGNASTRILKLTLTAQLPPNAVP